MLVQGVEVARFEEADGLDREPSGAVNLRFGLTASALVSDWLLSRQQGEAIPLDLAIVMIDVTARNEIMRWNLVQAVAQNWGGEPLDRSGRGGELAIAYLEIAHEPADPGDETGSREAY